MRCPRQRTDVGTKMTSARGSERRDVRSRVDSRQQSAATTRGEESHSRRVEFPQFWLLAGLKAVVSMLPQLVAIDRNNTSEVTLKRASIANRS